MYLLLRPTCLVLLMTASCRQAPADARPHVHRVRALVTGYEAARSAPLGPAVAAAASTPAAWDSLWRAAALPGRPPSVDFSRELAVLDAIPYGDGPIFYQSGVDSAHVDTLSQQLRVYIGIRMSPAGADTSSRKAVAAAISPTAGGLPWRGAVTFVRTVH